MSGIKETLYNGKGDSASREEIKRFMLLLFYHVQHASSFKPRILSLKWLSLSKLQKKIHTAPLGLQDELFSASEMLVSSVQVRREAS